MNGFDRNQFEITNTQIKQHAKKMVMIRVGVSLFANDVSKAKVVKRCTQTNKQTNERTKNAQLKIIIESVEKPHSSLCQTKSNTNYDDKSNENGEKKSDTENLITNTGAIC